MWIVVEGIKYVYAINGISPISHSPHVNVVFHSKASHHTVP